MKHAHDVTALNAIRRRKKYNSVGKHVRVFLTWRTPTEVLIYHIYVT